MEKKLTISVAAYNVEKYLNKLLDSIIQSHRMDEIEVLVVNDGSKDATAKIAEEYHQKFPKDIILINKENGGHGSTINTGILNAKGKYFKVIDGDDWVDSEGLCQFLDRLQEENSDIIVSDYQEIYEDSGKIINKNYPMFEAYKVEDFNEVCNRVNRLLFHAVFFKTEILQQHVIKIDENCFYVDSEYVMYPIPYVKKFVYYPINVYCYRLGDMGQSVSIQSLQKNIAMHLKVSKHLLEFYKIQEPKLESNVQIFLKSSVTMVNNKTIETLMSFPCRKIYKQEIKKLNKLMNEVIGDPITFIPTKTIKRMLKNIDLFYIPAWIWIKIKRLLHR